MTVHAYIGLGSNLESPLTQIEQAFDELAHMNKTQFIARSSLYSSLAIGPGNQPEYINAVALLATELSPTELLDALQAIEHAHRRVRNIHWGPRTLDLDLLLFGELEINSERLVVPHPFLTQRNFVLYPLFEVSPTLHIPNAGDLALLVAQCSPEGLKKWDATKHPVE
jgi:2-amino-4-hydroxy-6-hydroxymethyldihydropteridine diphosphokinase